MLVEPWIRISDEGTEVDIPMSRNSRKIGKHLWLILLPVSLALPLSAFAEVKCPQNEFMAESTPTNEFVLHDNGTVTHTPTGLIWMQCSFGQTWNSGTCVEDLETLATYTWQGALNAVADLNEGGGFAGHTDWRLPNKNELASIVEESCSAPTINEAIFPDTEPGTWWSSSPRAVGDRAWIVNFDSGVVGTQPRSLVDGRVRPVRAGQ
jgi:hypothetical protein